MSCKGNPSGYFCDAMTIHFGNDFDGPVLNDSEVPTAGVLYAGPLRLLQWLEAQTGLSGYPSNPDYLRIELYRQALGQLQDAFYSRSFEADRFATAEYLLGWRDELLLAGWDFAPAPDMPDRLRTLAEVELLFRTKISDPEFAHSTLGFADRFRQVMATLKSQDIHIDRWVFHEPELLQPPHIQAFVRHLRELTSCVIDGPTTPMEPDTPTLPETLIIRCRRDSDAAVFLAQLFSENPEVQPAVLLPAASLILEQALVREGLPAIGLQSASLARPSLQVLKLAPAFLWEPVDVFKIMEFLTLPLKPLDGGLALELARVMAEKPGFFSETWYAALFSFLDQHADADNVKKLYDFWFDRKRYPADKPAPKKDAVALYAFLREWALRSYEETGSTNSSLLVLAEQARRIQELLEALPEQRIGFLELERIVRTIFEASPAQLQPAEKGGFRFFHKPGAMAAETETLVWWNFIAGNENAGAEKWQPAERKWLESTGIFLQNPKQLSRLQLWLQQQPFRRCTGRLILIVPEYVDGAEAQPHLLLSDLEVALGEQFGQLQFDIRKPADLKRLAAYFKLPSMTELAVRRSDRCRPYVHIREPHKIAAAEYETPTNLEALFYYPHRWFFRQKLKLFPSSLLSVTGDTTLLGSLAHRFFEKLLEQDLSGISREYLYKWVDAEAEVLFPREGATLLLYGREPEKNAFLNRVKAAAWNLVSLIRSNEWNVVQTEMELETTFGETVLRGKADLILSRGTEKAIVDLKWSGAKRRKELMINGEDLQLVLYAKMLPPHDEWPHTAYFILDEGRIISRNAMAFREAIIAGRGGEPHIESFESVFRKMQNTFEWRRAQLDKGMVELRTARTAQELEALYEGQLFELLEMKTGDAPWDDYRALLA